MRTPHAIGPQNVNKAPISDQDKIKHAIRQAGTELFGKYKISKWELVTNWNLSLWSFLFDRNYRETVQGEFYAHLQKSINTTNTYEPQELPSLHKRIAKIPPDDLGDAEVFSIEISFY